MRNGYTYKDRLCHQQDTEDARAEKWYKDFCTHFLCHTLYAENSCCYFDLIVWIIISPVRLGCECVDVFTDTNVVMWFLYTATTTQSVVIFGGKYIMRFSTASDSKASL